MRKKLAAILAIALCVALAYFLGRSLAMPLPATTVVIGSNPITVPLQNGAVQETALVSGTGIVGASLPAASTAGTCLVAILAGTPSGANGIFPTGWTEIIAAAGGTTVLVVAIYPNNPGGIQGFGITVTAAGAPATWTTQVSEWPGVIGASAAETSGSLTSASGTTLTPVSAAAVVNTGDLGLAFWVQQIASTATVSFTSPAGFARLIDNGASNRIAHIDAEYRTGLPLGNFLQPTLTSDHTTTDATGGVIVLKAGTPKVDQSAFLEDGSITTKLNTSDFGLMLGGRLLLESDVAPDSSGYQLEDGSGVLLLDCYIPQLGDPVTWTGPTWSGRVTSVRRQNLVERQTNYAHVTVAATNASAAPGGTAPGDLSDVATGGYLQLEDASGDYQLEDGTGNYVLEGTTFRYRNLQHRQQQNQNGTVTVYGSLETFEGGYQAGQTFLLSNADLQLASVQYTITNVTTSYVASGASRVALYMIEFGDAYQTLQTAGGGVLTQVAAQATIQQGAAVPAGTLGYAQVVAAQGAINALVDITGLTVTVTVASGRRIQVSFYARISGTVAQDTFSIFINEGATVLQEDEAIIPNGGSLGTTGSVILTPTVGVHTYKLQAQRFNGTGTMTVAGSATTPAYIMVSDIGT